MTMNRHGLPVLRTADRSVIFKGRPPYPPVITRKLAATVYRLTQMQQDLDGGSR